METDYERIGYQFGQFTMGVLFLALIVWGIVAISRNNAKQSSLQPSRDPRADLALLARSITVHGTAERALALVSGIAAASRRLVPVAGPVPTWRIDGGHPVVSLEPTPAGSVLAVRELVVPLPSPQGAIVWEWVVAQVEHASARDGLRTSHSEQRFVQAMPIDAHSAVWSSAD